MTAVVLFKLCWFQVRFTRTKINSLSLMVFLTHSCPLHRPCVCVCVCVCITRNGFCCWRWSNMFADLDIYHNSKTDEKPALLKQCAVGLFVVCGFYLPSRLSLSLSHKPCLLEGLQVKDACERTLSCLYVCLWVCVFVHLWAPALFCQGKHLNWNLANISPAVFAVINWI